MVCEGFDNMFIQEQLLGQLRTALQGNSDRIASKEQEVQVHPGAICHHHSQRPYFHDVYLFSI